MDLQSEFPKKTLFWKYMIAALKAMEQEYELYQRLAKDRQFDMSRHLGKTMARFYQAAATGCQPDEKYILAVEESFFEPRDDYERLALRIVEDLQDFFYVAYEKDCKKAGLFLERPFRVLEQFYSFSPNIDLEKAREEEQEFLRQLIQEAVSVDKSGKKAYIEAVKNRKVPRLIGDELLENRGSIKKEKPVKKVFPLIRRTSLRYDYDLKADRALPEGAPRRITEGREEILAGWYISVLKELYELEMYEYGYPFGRGNVFTHHERHMEAAVSASMIRAYAAGAKELIPRLFYYSYDKSSKGIHDLLCGNGEPGQFPDKDDEGHFNRGVRAILEGNGEELTKALLKRVRYIRGWYELYAIAADEWGYALVRLADEAGLSYEKVAAAELLDSVVCQPDISRIRLEHQEEMDRWLERAKEEYFRLNSLFPYVEEGKTARRPDTSLDSVSYLVRSEEEETARLCREFDYRALHEYAEGLIKEEGRQYFGYVLRAYAHMQIYRERFSREQVKEDLSRAIDSCRKKHVLTGRTAEIMARRSRLLLCEDRESEQYGEDMEFLRSFDEEKGWYYRMGDV